MALHPKDPVRAVDLLEERSERDDELTFSDMEISEKLTKDLLSAAGSLGRAEARLLVSMYYIVQKQRLRLKQQVAALEKEDKPNDVLKFFHSRYKVSEAQIKIALQKYAESDELGMWMLSNKGIGPVLAAGLLAQIDFTGQPFQNSRGEEIQINTAGKIWAFAGYDPTRKWGKGEKCPWNRRLKTLCWRIGQSFVYQSGPTRNAYYGKVYAARKRYEQEKNEKGDYKPLAEETLATRKFREETKAYEAYIQGKLPDARIQLRSQRYAVKLFLAHCLEMAYTIRGEEPPLPYAIAILKHDPEHYIPPPQAEQSAP